ncbi:hypothetical protein LCGC14_1377840 [marine sediment metagenome]|uniref:DUF2958 domain-containing protein n=1 Tax=marine sediment metagenome TaxID=412755 RepID=A0A0F9MIV4_9ZZZZ
MAAANKLVTKTAFRKVPPIGSQDGLCDEAVVYAKVFCPQNGWRWYITEYNPETGEAFGLVQGHEVELGTFALDHPSGVDSWGGEDMQSQNDNWQGRYSYPPFERDLHFRPTTIEKVRESLANGRPA